MASLTRIMAPETPAVFGGDRKLFGVVTRPAGSDGQARPPAVILLNSGRIHRVGPNRLHVRLSRRLATRGFTSLRFDFSGVGDSLPAGDARPTQERWVSEIRSSMDFLEREFGETRFVLAGNCSGAIGAFLTAQVDPRVAAAALVNPPPPRVPGRYWLRLATSQPNAWRRLLTGSWKGETGRAGAASSSTVDAASSASTNDVSESLLRLARKGIELLVIHSEWDPGFDYFHRSIQSRVDSDEAGSRVEFQVVRGANHDFSLLSGQEALLGALEGWLRLRGTA